MNSLAQWTYVTPSAPSRPYLCSAFPGAVMMLRCAAGRVMLRSNERPHPTTIGHLSGDQRAVLSAVALAYRRAYRAANATERSRPPDIQADASDVAVAEYLRSRPEAAADRLAASARVNEMAAAAINANVEWFWHGPDA